MFMARLSHTVSETDKGKEVSSKKKKGKGQRGSVRSKVGPKNVSAVDNVLNGRLTK